MDEFALTVLEHLLRTPSLAVPTLFPAASSQTSLGLSTHSSFTARSSDGIPHPNADLDACATHATASSGHQKGMHGGSHATQPSIVSLARAALLEIHCEGLVAGNIDAGASMKLSAQMRRHLASAAAALCPRMARLSAAAGPFGVGADVAGQDNPENTSNKSMAHERASALSSNQSCSGAHRGRRKGGRGAGKHKGALRRPELVAGTTPPLLPAAARPLQRCVTLREGSTHALKLNINMHGQEKSALVVYFQVRVHICLASATKHTPALDLLYSLWTDNSTMSS